MIGASASPFFGVGFRGKLKTLPPRVAWVAAKRIF